MRSWGKQRRWHLNQFGVGQKQSLTTLLNARMIFSVFLGKNVCVKDVCEKLLFLVRLRLKFWGFYFSYCL